MTDEIEELIEKLTEARQEAGADQGVHIYLDLNEIDLLTAAVHAAGMLSEFMKANGFQRR